MSESHWWYRFHKEVKSWGSTTWFRIWQFQSIIFKCISWLNGSYFWGVNGDDRGFLKEGVENYLMVPTKTCQLFICLRIYSLRFHLSPHPLVNTRSNRVRQPTWPACVVGKKRQRAVTISKISFFFSSFFFFLFFFFLRPTKRWSSSSVSARKTNSTGWLMGNVLTQPRSLFSHVI